MARDTVERATPAASATSAIVGRDPARVSLPAIEASSKSTLDAFS
jgi:hypothetical protein